MENNDALAMLKKYIKVFANSRQVFDITVPGSQIPEWFSHQSDESSIKITLPPNIRNDSKWMGVAFCCIFVSAFTDQDDVCTVDEITCEAVIHGVNSRPINRNSFIFGRKYRRPRVMKDHLWLRYWSRDKLYPLSLEEKCGENLKDQECEEIFQTSMHCKRIDIVKKSTSVDGSPKDQCGVKI
ncbi:hypothetical protein PTKIN_Ptkin14bG0134800 [Pterospermum kingtungense]